MANAMLTIKQVQAEARRIGMTITKRGWGGQYRVNYRGATESTVYYTDDRDDALATARRMAEERDTRTWDRTIPRRGDYR